MNGSPLMLNILNYSLSHNENNILTGQFVSPQIAIEGRMISFLKKLKRQYLEKYQQN